MKWQNFGNGEYSCCWVLGISVRGAGRREVGVVTKSTWGPCKDGTVSVLTESWSQEPTHLIKTMENYAHIHTQINTSKTGQS